MKQLMESWNRFINETTIKDADIDKLISDNSLYHATTKENAKNILKHDYFRTEAGITGIKGLSTTFDKGYRWGSNEALFMLDYEKLKRDFELIYVNEELGVDESGIKIVSTPPIMNAKKNI